MQRAAKASRRAWLHPAGSAVKMGDYLGYLLPRGNGLDTRLLSVAPTSGGVPLRRVQALHHLGTKLRDLALETVRARAEPAHLVLEVL